MLAIRKNEEAVLLTRSMVLKIIKMKSKSILTAKTLFSALGVLYFFGLLMPLKLAGQETDSTLTKINSEWVKSFNDSKNLKSYYSENSGLLLNDTLYVGITAIEQQLKGLKKHIPNLDSYEVLNVYQLYDGSKFVLGNYKVQGKVQYSTIIGWRKEVTWIKEFEVIYKWNKEAKSETQGITIQREMWEKFSNRHRPDLITTQVFSHDGKYFNRGRRYLGKEITAAYSYMNNESYRIRLEPLNVLQVNNTIAFEIGTFHTRGKGLYTLIWRKEAEAWKLLLDFNF